MFNDPMLAVLNCVLIGGIVAALLASVLIKRSTRELQAQNAAQRRQDQDRHSLE